MLAPSRPIRLYLQVPRHSTCNQASAAAAGITEFSGGTLSVTLGGASGGFSSNAILSDSSITIDGTNSKGAMTFGTVTASGAISITLGGVGVVLLQI